MVEFLKYYKISIFKRNFNGVYRIDMLIMQYSERKIYILVNGLL